MSHNIQKVVLLFWKLLSYLVCIPIFKSINSSSLSRKKYDGVNFTSTLRLQGQIMLVELTSVELSEPSDTLNYKPFFKHCFLQTILHVFLLLIFV